ncbi:EAL domain-containing protein [Photobacterium leiognathi]|uniref:EAL domain-containing protein n=1 Tax=Photobacterium leiognathi TaxID=553611 RepID=UPI000D16903D|nr:EAL domain-containing protein [Photobacterium leiognathi]PSW45997.1 EAL domain-containing protein [Photobacterium leiognathi subsp. mandapamensis]
MKINKENRVHLIIYSTFFILMYLMLLSINFSFYKSSITKQAVIQVDKLIDHSKKFINRMDSNILERQGKEKHLLLKLLARDANVNISSIAIIKNGQYVYNTLIGQVENKYHNSDNLGLTIKERSNLTERPVISFLVDVGNDTIIQAYFKKLDLELTDKLGRSYVRINNINVGHDNKLIDDVSELNSFEIKSSKYDFSFIIECQPRIAFTNYLKDSTIKLIITFVVLLFIFYFFYKYNNIDYYLLRKAITNNEICPYIQPIVDQDKRVIGGEVLARWFKRNGTMVSPMEFIPKLEKYSLIPLLTTQLLTQVLHSELLKRSENLMLSFNLTEKCLHDKNIQALCIKLAAHCQLVLEFTESSEFENVSETLETMQLLRLHGIQFALDDYGTGYSSLYYLNLYDFDSLKIDKSFVDKIELSELTLHIIESIVLLASKLNIKLIAEGVENKEQLSTLEKLGVHKYQGFLFYKPESIASFSSRL